MAYPNGLSDCEKKAIAELEKRMENELSSEFLDIVDSGTFPCYRFLKARNFDVDKAKNMFRKHLVWRKSFQLSRLLEDFKPKEFFIRYVQPTFIGLNKEGYSVVYSACGKLETSDVLKCVKMNDYLKHIVWFFLKNLALRRKIEEETGKKCKQLIVIMDCDKVSFANLTSNQTSEVFLRLLRIVIDNFPEFLQSVFIINAPSFFVLLFSILKTVLSRELIQKFKVFGHVGWKEKLLENIDADILPAFLGGTRTDPDGNPLCTTFVSHGGKIPEIYHLQDEERWFKDKTMVTKIVVPASERKEIYVAVEESGYLIQWEFLIHKKNIGFGLFLKSYEEELEEVLPIQLFETKDGTETGNYRTHSAGKS